MRGRSEETICTNRISIPSVRRANDFAEICCSWVLARSSCFLITMKYSAKKHRFIGQEYITALQRHYPQFFDAQSKVSVDRALHIGIVKKWIDNFEIVGTDDSTRFQSIRDRSWTSDRSAWAVSGGGTNLRYASVYCSYKGLINLKTAIDLVLYSNLIWELQPRVILEFGSLQGGSALWFSDQLDVLCSLGEVHSFELCYECISPRAAHPRLHFHKADLRDIGSLDTNLLTALPHPWLVVDDAHENLENVVPFIVGFMSSGDYYVVEDVFQYHPLRGVQAHPIFSADVLTKVADSFDSLGFLVDTKYADAFGQNVTCAPNGWLVKK